MIGSPGILSFNRAFAFNSCKGGKNIITSAFKSYRRQIKHQSKQWQEMNHPVLQLHYKWKKKNIFFFLLSQAKKSTEADQSSQPLYRETWFKRLSCRDRGTWTNERGILCAGSWSLYSYFQPAHHHFPFFSPFCTDLSLHPPPAAPAWIGQFSSWSHLCPSSSTAEKPMLQEHSHSFHMTAAALTCLVVWHREVAEGRRCLEAPVRAPAHSLYHLGKIQLCTLMLAGKASELCILIWSHTIYCSHFYPSIWLQQITWLDFALSRNWATPQPSHFQGRETEALRLHSLNWCKQMRHYSASFILIYNRAQQLCDSSGWDTLPLNWREWLMRTDQEPCSQPYQYSMPSPLFTPISFQNKTTAKHSTASLAQGWGAL